MPSELWKNKVFSATTEGIRAADRQKNRKELVKGALPVTAHKGRFWMDYHKANGFTNCCDCPFSTTRIPDRVFLEITDVSAVKIRSDAIRFPSAV